MRKRYGKISKQSQAILKQKDSLCLECRGRRMVFFSCGYCRSSDGKSESKTLLERLKIKLTKEGSELYDKIVQLKLIAPDGKLRETDVLSTKNVLRLIQSIPSPKAEPFKMWLAEVGNEVLNESVDPELSIDRAIQNYRKLGYSEGWINQRIKAIEVRGSY